MKNVTLAIDEELLGKARALAERRKTSLNAMVRALLAHEVEQEDRIAWARSGLRRLLDESTLDMGPDWRWNRQDAYAEREDRLLPRHERPDLRGAGESER
ncbi:ribbon-helix-helix protein, CopG family [Aurantimonas sp. Leaf443]|uniref:ribbon-helix-helix protein, CopG family n=1 Tax=Aurantimonas sp. Leaf443 TaxID=1736378 RepID=UPI000B055E67|nr:ribbon-helix-helix protein, CopG family [Aurantimonas sp. Leaf443]